MRKYITIFIILLQSSLLFAQTITSKLPIVKINTLGNTIVDNPKVMATISVINNASGSNNSNDPTNDLISDIAIEIRGSSSQGFPKKSYGLELRDAIATTQAINKTFLGMPAESDWILYAPYTDKTFIRDVLTHTLAQSMGQYAPRCQMVELLINGNYEGVYVAQEKIKRDSNRVDIAKLLPTDNSGVALTGGYILKIDKTTGTFAGGFSSNITNYQGNNKNIFFQYDYPSDPTAQQQNYIAQYVDSFEQAMLMPNWKDPSLGYKKYINVNSFIDFFLLNELSHNVDGYRLSTYLHKKKMGNGDGKIHMGPVWDFNLAYGNADYCDGWRTDTWAIYQPCNGPDYPFWWDRFFQDTSYTAQLKCKYINYRNNELSNANLFAKVDSLVNKIGTAATNRNYNKWPILGTYVWPNNYVGNTYAEEIDSLKSYLTQRLNWMDNNMPGKVCQVTPLAASWLPIENMLVYPTICKDYINIKYATNNSFTRTIKIYSLDGVLQKTMETNFSPYQDKVTIDISSLAAGSYIIATINDTQAITNTFKFCKL